MRIRFFVRCGATMVPRISRDRVIVDAAAIIAQHGRTIQIKGRGEMNSLDKIFGLATLTLALGACSSMATISAHDPGTKLLVKGRTVELPVTQNMNGTRFGNY